MAAQRFSLGDDLLNRIRSGDDRAKNEAFHDLRVRFLLIAKRRLGERDAEDAAQEACITVFEKYPTVSAETNFTMWALQVLRNKIGNRLQQRQRSTEDEWDDRSAPTVSQAPALLEFRMIDCLRRIFQVNRRYGRVLNLIHLGYTAEEISARLGITKNNLYVLLNRSRQQLKQCLEEKGE